MSDAQTYVMLFSIWYFLYNFKNVKNTCVGVLLFVSLLHGCGGVIRLILSIKLGQYGPQFPDVAVWTAKGKDSQYFFYGEIENNLVVLVMSFYILSLNSV